jgi:hypothetical protein
MYEVNGGALYITESAVIFTLKKDISIDDVKQIDEKSKKKLGEGSIYITKDKIKAVRAASDPKYSMIIEAKGMADDIGVNALSSEVQSNIIRDVQSLVGREGEISVKEAGIFARSGKHIILSMITAVLTFCLYYLVTTLNGAEVDIQGRHATSKEMLYRIADTLGPSGTIIAGGLITALLIFKAYKKSKLTYQINIYLF